MLSENGEYLIDTETRVPLKRLKPFKGYLCDDPSIYILGDMEKFNLNPNLEDDRKRYQQICIEKFMNDNHLKTFDEFSSFLEAKEREFNELPYYAQFVEELQPPIKSNIVIPNIESDDELSDISEEILVKKGYKGMGRGSVSIQRDYYETPSWSINVFLNMMNQSEKINGSLKFYDPCKGNGVIGNAIRNIYPDANIVETDIHGEVSEDYFKSNFDDYDFLITNPPYSCKTDFLKKAFEANKPFALLLPLQTLQTPERMAMMIMYDVTLFLLYPNPVFNDESGKKVSVREVSWFYFSGKLRNRGDPIHLHYVCNSDTWIKVGEEISRLH